MNNKTLKISEQKHKRKTILIIGFGQVGKKILAMKSFSKELRSMKFVCACRTEIIEKKLYQKQTSFLSIDVDHKKNIERLANLCDRLIVLTPTNDSRKFKKDNLIDTRMHNLKLAMLKNNNWKKKGVYISTTGVYGNKKGTTVDETESCYPTTKRSSRRLYAERILRNLQFHILRVPGIYSIDRLPILRLQRAVPALNDYEDVYTNHIHETDLAKISYFALFRGKVHRITNAVDNSNLKMGQYFDLIASAVGLEKPPRVSLKEIENLEKSEKISPMAASFFYESRRLKNNRLKKEIKTKFDYPTVRDFIKKNSKNLSTLRQKLFR